MQKGRLVGRGARSDIYEWGKGRVLKLMKPGISLDAAKNEARNTDLAFAAGLPVPRVYEVIEMEGRPGIVYEHIKGDPVDRHIKAATWRTGEFARQAAEVHTRVHQITVAGLRDVKHRLRSAVLRSKLGEAVQGQVLQRLQGLPDGTALLHFDFHPLNLVLSGQRIYIIDWDNACTGDPLADVARTCLISSLAEYHVRPGLKRILVRHFSRVMRDEYVKRYAEISAKGTESLRHWISVVAAARMAEGFAEEVEPLKCLAAAVSS
ncbi:MAG: aminoglycoside phosphotransferase family protein [Bacillota bacterium]|nr:aminoglycoside phosphotransferase family protein [Bacillota bacterium]